MRTDSKKLLLSYFNDEKNKENLLNIFTQEQIEYFIKENNNLINKINNKNKEILISNCNLNTNQKDIMKSDQQDNSTFTVDTILKHASIMISNIINEIGSDLPPEDIKFYIENGIPFTLFTKSKINFHINKRWKRPDIIYDDIYLGKNNMQYDTEKFKKNKIDYIKIKKVNDLVENYIKFFEFLNEVENIINNEFYNNYKLQIALNFNKENIQNSNPSIYNISCIYNFYGPINGKTFAYKDVNILENGTNSYSQGLTFLLEDINSEQFKDIEYC